MHDSCEHCVVRGNMQACLTTPCSTRTSWFAQALLAEIGISALRGDGLEAPTLAGVKVVSQAMTKLPAPQAIPKPLPRDLA